MKGTVTGMSLGKKADRTRGEKRPSYRELYPEQFAPLAGEEELELKAERKHAVKLGDIEERNGRVTFVEKVTDSSKKQSLEKLKKSFDGGDRNEASYNGAVGKGNSEESDDAVILRKNKKKSAVAYAMTVVSRSTVNELALKSKLQARGYSEDETEEALSYVKKFGYVDDARLAQNMLDGLAARCWGKFKICRYLTARGFSSEIVESLDFSDIDFPAYCAKLMGRYPPERREAMLRAVKNAGYTSSDIRLAKELIEDTQ